MRAERLGPILCSAGLLLACGKGGEAKGPAVAVDALPFTGEQWAVLHSLAPPQLPGSLPDVSNAHADDPKAALLGQKLFFDPGFAGKLLDADNDGGPNTLGTQGSSARVACAGCHQTSAAFSDTRSTFQQISLGSGWTHRRTPSVLDVGQAKIVMWGGRFSTLWSQPFGPFENPLEMNSSRLFVAEQIAARYQPEYEAIFGAGSLSDFATSTRFPALTADSTGCALNTPTTHPRAVQPDPLYTCHGTPGDQAEYDALSSADQMLVTQVVANAGKVLAAYERKLSCGPSRFDAWVNGDSAALTLSEQRGVLLFIDKGKCVSCHSGPFMSDQKFHNVGLNVEITKEGIFNGNDSGASVDLLAAKSDPVGVLGPFSDGDDGRLPSNLDSSYVGAFRTPTLRCVSKRPTFMHSGTLPALDSVVGFFSMGGNHTGFPGTSELTPLNLSAQELNDLVAFLKALDGPGPEAALLGPPS